MQSFDLASQNRSEVGLNSSPALLTADIGQLATSLSTAIAPLTSRSALLFVDAGVSDYQSLLAGVQPETEVHVLDAAQDAVGQITQTLMGRQGIASLHILSHGQAGGLEFGQAWVTLANLNTYTLQLQTWQSALTADADILLYGCNVGSGEMGQAFMQILSQLTGADVAASDNLTGSAAQGGDWILERRVGDIATPLAISSLAQTTYASVLDAQVRAVTNFTNPTVPSTATNLTNVNGAVYFTANDGSNSSQLWRVTPSGPYTTAQMVGQPGTNPANLTNVNGTLYFTATEGTANRLYRLASNPTNPSYPELVETIPMPGSNPSNLRVVNDTLFLTVNEGSSTNLWKIPPAVAVSPGVPLQPAVPQLILIGGNTNPNPSNFTNLNGTLYFFANTGSSEMLWKLEPSKTTAVMIGGTAPNSDLNNLINVNGKLYFTVTDGALVRLSTVDRPSDPNLSETLTPIASPAFTNLQGLTSVNGVIYFTATDAVEGTELWSLNPQQGNAVTPAFVRSGAAGSDPINLTNVNGKLYFIATDDVTGRELRRFNPGTNGSPNFTETIEFIYGSASSNPANLLNLNGTLYFTAKDSPLGEPRLWQIQPGPNGANGYPTPVYLPNGSTNLANLTIINGALYFTTSNMPGQTALWKIDANSTIPGNPPTPKSLGSVNTVAGAPLANWLMSDGKVFFTANTTPQSTNVFVVESQAPSVNVNNTYLTYIENSTPILIADFANVYDPDTINLRGATLKVGLQGGTGTFDRLSILANNEVTLAGNVIKVQGLRIGTYSGGSQSDLIITFDADNVNSFGIAQVLRRIAYHNTSESLAEYQTLRTIEIKLLDGEGGVGVKTLNLNLQGSNDAPIVGVNRLLSNITPSYGPNSNAGWQEYTPNGLMPSPPPSLIFSAPLDLQRQVAYGINTSTLVEGPITLDATTGFAVNFRANLRQENHTSATDINLDGKVDQSGFNILVISNDNTKAIKLGFFSDRIWAYNSDGTQGESAQFNTQLDRPYQVVVKGDTYTLMAGGVELLSDKLRNYSSLPSPLAANNPGNPNPSPNPYTQTNYIFFGDDATTASTEVVVNDIQVLGSPSVWETTTSPSGYGLANPTIGEIRSIDVDGYSSTSFSLQDPINSPFEAFSFLRLKTGATLDYETQNSYTLIFNGPLGQQPQLKVNVLDIMEVNKVGREDNSIAFTANDFTSLYNQPGSAPLTRIRLMTAPSNGTLKLGGINISGGIEINVAQLNDLTFNPDANFNGAVTLNWDAFNGTTWASINNANPATLPVINLTITPVNDAPIFTLGAIPNQTVTAGAGGQTLNLLALPAESSAQDERNQTIAYEIVSNSNPSIFDGTPTIDANGRFTYKPMVSGAGGTATIGIRAKDSGGTANGGVDTSAIPTFTITVNAPPSDWQMVSQTDFDGDGTADILWRNSVTGGAAIWKMAGTTFVSATALPVIDLSWQMAGVADFDKNGSADILLRNQATGTTAIWLMNGFNVINSVALPFAGLEWQIAGLADFNKDGFMDILWRNQTSGSNAIWQMAGTTVATTISLSATDATWKIAGLGDLDGDGFVDILWRNQTSGANAFWKLNGTTVQTAVALSDTDSTWQVAGIADFDKNGTADILWRNTTTGSTAIWKMAGGANPVAVNLGFADLGFQVAGITDLDGDGVVDIIWRNRTTGNNALWKLNGTTITSAIALRPA